MNATTPTLWAIAALLAATFAFPSAGASADETALDACDFVQFRNGVPEYHPECLPSDDALQAHQPASQNLSADP